MITPHTFSRGLRRAMTFHLCETSVVKFFFFFLHSWFCFVMMEEIYLDTHKSAFVYIVRVGSPLLLCVKHTAARNYHHKKNKRLCCPNSKCNQQRNSLCMQLMRDLQFSFLLEIINIKSYQRINWVKRLNLHPYIDFLRSFYANAPYKNIIAENENCMNIVLFNFITARGLAHVFRLLSGVACILNERRKYAYTTCYAVCIYAKHQHPWGVLSNVMLESKKFHV